MKKSARQKAFLLPALGGALCAALVACGFHLTGTQPLPEALSSVYIDMVTPYRVSKPPLESALRAALLRRGAVVTERSGDARTVLTLTELSEGRQVLSVDPAGKAVEYRLTTGVRYQLTANGQALVPPDVMHVARDYSFNAQQVLAKEAEEARLQAYLQEDLATLLLLRLESLLNRPAQPAAPANPPVAAPTTSPDARPAP